MADNRTAETLRKKRGKLARSIDDYEARLAQTKADLAHMDAAIPIFATRTARSPLGPKDILQIGPLRSGEPPVQSFSGDGDSAEQQ